MFDLSKILIDYQIKKINLNINNLLKKKKLKKNTPLLFTGIGRKILKKKLKTHQYLKLKNLLRLKTLS